MRRSLILRIQAHAKRARVRQRPHRVAWIGLLAVALVAIATAGDGRAGPRDPEPTPSRTPATRAGPPEERAADQPPDERSMGSEEGEDGDDEGSDAAEATVPPRAERPQFVLFCFDATPIWGKTLEDNNVFKLLTRARAARPADYVGEDPTITVFINTGYLQLRPTWRPKKGSADDEKGPSWYKPFRARADREPTKVLHYGKDPDWILERAARIRRMHEMGVEVASHGVMHLNGGQWSLAEWRREFDEHQRVLDLLGLPAPRGYRAPFLATRNVGPATLADPLFQVLHERGFRFDSSKSYTRGPRWPRKIVGTEIWEHPIETTFIDGERQIMFTDYGTSDSKKHFEASMKEFRKRYDGERAPIILGGHGEHMASNLKLMKTICYLPDVRCGTFSELVAYMDAHPELSGYKGPLAQGPVAKRTRRAPRARRASSKAPNPGASQASSKASSKASSQASSKASSKASSQASRAVQADDDADR